MSRARSTFFACAAMLALFASLAWFAVRAKSPAYDEPLHAVSAWLNLRHGDYRVDPEDPPLWKYWAALPNSAGAIDADLKSQLFTDIVEDISFEWHFCVRTLFQTESNLSRSESFIARSRVMMLILAVGLGAMIAWWSWRLGGAVAAMVATAGFALDPNFIAHGPLIKNDVVFTLMIAALAHAVWRVGERVTAGRAIALAALCAVALNVKFSGILLGPIVAALLFGRAMMRWPWTCLGRSLERRRQRFSTAAMLCVLCLIVSFGGIWACYRFRFAATPQPNLALNTQRLLVFAAANELTLANGGVHPSAEAIQRWRPNFAVRAILFLESAHTLPQAWLHGLLYTYQSAILRQTFLLGKYSKSGWWYYFPVTMVAKATIGSLIALMAALAVAVRAKRDHKSPSPSRAWACACLIVPPALYLAWAMQSNLNIGLRHVFPVYPFLYIGLGLAAAHAWTMNCKRARAMITVLALVAGVETLAAFPDFLPFFNVAAGGTRGGLRIAGDSNLDWGQDLKELSRWQQENPNQPLFVAYFGTADPAFYNIEYHNMPGKMAYQFGKVFDEAAGQRTHVLAISATHLQGIYLTEPERNFVAQLRQRKPLAVLGGSIYLFEMKRLNVAPQP